MALTPEQLTFVAAHQKKRDRLSDPLKSAAFNLLEILFDIDKLVSGNQDLYAAAYDRATVLHLETERAQIETAIDAILATGKCQSRKAMEQTLKERGKKDIPPPPPIG